MFSRTLPSRCPVCRHTEYLEYAPSKHHKGVAYQCLCGAFILANWDGRKLVASVDMVWLRGLLNALKFINRSTPR